MLHRYKDENELKDEAYNELPVDDITKHQPDPRSKVAFVVTLITILFALVGITGLTANVAAISVSSKTRVAFWNPEGSAAAVPPFLDCGADIDTALERGCRFDHMGGWWTPQLCYDEALALEMNEGRNGEHDRSLAARFGLDKFSWFQEQNKSSPLPQPHDLESHLITQGRRGEPMVAFSDVERHAAHCVYLLTIAQQALAKMKEGQEDVWVPWVLTRHGHEEHCEILLGSAFLRRNRGGSLGSYTEVGFELLGCDRFRPSY